MDSIRASEALDSGSIPDEATKGRQIVVTTVCLFCLISGLLLPVHLSTGPPFISTIAATDLVPKLSAE
jgi:hypothetical protein